MDQNYPLPPRLAAIAKDLPLRKLAFTPVPVKARHDGWTPERQRAFILRLALSGSVSRSAEAVGMTARTAYRLCGHPEAASFIAAWDRALHCGLTRRVDYALERSLLGDVRAVFYRGRKVGEQIRYSHGLTIAVLNQGDARQRRIGKFRPTENK